MTDMTCRFCKHEFDFFAEESDYMRCPDCGALNRAAEPPTLATNIARFALGILIIYGLIAMWSSDAAAQYQPGWYQHQGPWKCASPSGSAEPALDALAQKGNTWCNAKPGIRAVPQYSHCAPQCGLLKIPGTFTVTAGCGRGCPSSTPVGGCTGGASDKRMFHAKGKVRCESDPNY